MTEWCSELKKKRKLLAFSTMEEAPVNKGASVSNLSGKRRKRKCKFSNCHVLQLALANWISRFLS